MLSLLQELFSDSLLGVYLYGSYLVGGLQLNSDLDFFVVLERPSTNKEQALLVKGLLKLSGPVLDKERLPIELTLVDQGAIKPWRYPPKFDFQYGEWLRDSFEKGDLDPWGFREMPDLALLITQVLLASEVLFGQKPYDLLSEVPYRDVVLAIKEGIKEWTESLERDTRNVVLALARILNQLKTDTIASKSVAVDQVISWVPEEYHVVLKRVQMIYEGAVEENWGDLKEPVIACVQWMSLEANRLVTSILSSDCSGRVVKLG